MMHLGTRVAALVDGQLSPAEEERAWAHVHACPTCRAAVEREGWVKRQLACLSFVDTSTQSAAVSAALKGSLCGSAFASYPETMPEYATAQRTRRFASLAALGAGSAGAAMFGVLALGTAPAEAPVMDRRAPATTSLLGGSPATAVPVGNRNRQDEVDAIKRVVSAWVRMGL